MKNSAKMNVLGLDMTNSIKVKLPILTNWDWKLKKRPAFLPLHLRFKINVRQIIKTIIKTNVR
jgi:hypothetical protein